MRFLRLDLAHLAFRRPRPPCISCLSPRRNSSSPSSALIQLLEEIRHALAPPLEPRLPFDEPVDHLISSLNTAISNVAKPPPRLRLAIWGDRASRASELVESLLHNPLASDPQPAQLLRERVPGPDGLLEIRYAPAPRSDHSKGLVELPSAWLRDHRVDILELSIPSNHHPLNLPPCDLHLLLLFDQIRPPSELLPLIRSLAHSRAFFILLNSISTSLEEKNGLDEALDVLIHPSSNLLRPSVMRINTFSAIQALRTISSSPPQFDEDKLLGSGLYTLRDRIVKTLEQPDSHIRTSITTGRLALSAISNALLRIEETLSDRQAKLHDFEIEIERIGKLATQALVARMIDGEAKQRLPGFRELISSSEVVQSLGDEKRLNHLLAFQAGQLSILASQIRSTTQTFLSVPLTAPKWVSEVTRNQVDQALDRLPLTDTSADLSGIARLQGPFITLQSRAQQLVISGGLVGVGLSSLLLANAVKHIIDGLAIGAAVVVLGVWKAQQDWERAKANFIKDWNRSKANLESELDEQANEMVNKQLLVGPRLLVRESKKKIERERDCSRALAKSLQQFRARLKEIEGGLGG